MQSYLDCVGFHEAYDPQENYCVISCGTALTIDLADGLTHLGGYILPNLYLQRDALIQNTKGIKIPDAAFDELTPGRSTIDAVHHGILLGLLSTIEHVIRQSPRKLILTGGDAPLWRGPGPDWIVQPTRCLFRA